MDFSTVILFIIMGLNISFSFIVLSLKIPAIFRNGDAFKCHGLPDGSVAVYVREGAVYIGVDQIPNPQDVQ